jgi:hypothetical protein
MLVGIPALITAAAEGYAGTGAANLLRNVSLQPIDAAPKPVPPDLHPTLQKLPPGRLRDLLIRNAACFDWLTGEGNLAGRIASAEIAGPDGLARIDALRIGVFLQAPETHYPSHSHAAEELYLVLTGNALWQKDAGQFVAIPPGATVLHLSYQRHAMKTEQEPLLALWLWTGDLSFSSYRLHDTA